MALTKEQLDEARETLSAEFTTDKQKRDGTLREKIREAAHKTSTHAHYVVGAQGAYSEGRRYQPGEVIKLTLDKLPSITFRPASSKGIAAASRAAALKADETAELVAELDETEPTDPDDEADDDLEDDEPKAAPKKSGKVVPAKKSGKGRAADQDIE